MKKEIEPLPLIATAIGTVIATVAVLGYYGYLHFAKPEDALELRNFTMIKIINAENPRAAAPLAGREVYATCRDNIVLLKDEQQEGMLVDSKGRTVLCSFDNQAAPIKMLK